MKTAIMYNMYRVLLESYVQNDIKNVHMPINACNPNLSKSCFKAVFVLVQNLNAALNILNVYLD